LKQVIIIGGGLAGLIASIKLVRENIPCLLIEKKNYPQHRVCGEYISNEVVPFLKSQKLFPSKLNPVSIDTFLLSSTSGKHEKLKLDLGGFGISRYAFDFFLAEEAKKAGVEFLLDTTVENVNFFKNEFEVSTSTKSFSADVVIGAYGKRSKLDKNLQRPFMQKKSPYVGIKYHIRYNHHPNTIALHNFPQGYCGMSNVENGITNLCYLVHRQQLKRAGSIEKLEQQVLSTNPFLSDVFNSAEFLWESPETINEISFETKSPVENHMLMAGDAAGMITPLCGNGMAMAIRAGILAAQSIASHYSDIHHKRNAMEEQYARAWRNEFQLRLFRGRQLQHLFGSKWMSSLAVNIALHAKPLANYLVQSAHGEPF
jgi:flavin-dependent dehydrogenase